jgi:osmotically inducible protein OsmC
MPTRTARAEWNGTLREGEGVVALGSGAFSGAYSFSSRFEDGTGTNPEELLGAAHAGCFSMALALGLERAGHPPESIRTVASVNIEPQDGGFAIKRSALKTEASVPGIEPSEFERLADEAKANCPVSRALAGVEIRLEARLV